MVLGVLGCATILGGWDCGSGLTTGDAGPSVCSRSLAEMGPCEVTLTGAATARGACRPTYAVYNSGAGSPGSTSLGSLSASNLAGAGGLVRSVNVNLAWNGAPALGPQQLIAASDANGVPSAASVTLSDGGRFEVTYGRSGGGIAFDISKAEVEPGADACVPCQEFWCLDGVITADLPSVSDATAVVHLVMSFDAGI